MGTQKVILITGASKGFGKEITKAALENGDKVIATVRKIPEELVDSFHGNSNLLVVLMDVTIEEQIRHAVFLGLTTFGRIDVLINNAGYGIISAIEEATDAEVKKQYETNVFGMLNVIRAVLPHMRAARSGHIINFSAVFAFDAVPGWGLYGSTKCAVEGLSKGLAVELAPLGINVTAVEPGLFRTQFFSVDSFLVAENIIGDYHQSFEALGDVGKTIHGNEPGDPVKLAKVIINLIHTENPPVQLPIGSDSINTFYRSAKKTEEIIEKWREIATSTDVEDAKQIS